MVVIVESSSNDHHQPIALNADQYVGVVVSSGAPDLIDVHHARASSHQHGHFPVTRPAKGRNAGGELLVIFAAQDRIDDKRFEPRIPQPPRFRGPGIDIGGPKGNLTGIEKYRFAQILRSFAKVIFDDFDRDFNQLKGLLKADRA
jgi:hypothetical protein